MHVIAGLIWIILHRPTSANDRTHNKPSSRPLKPRTSDDCPHCRATLGAYRADLLALNQRLLTRNVELARAGRADVLDYIAWRVEAGAKPTIIALDRKWILAAETGIADLYSYQPVVWLRYDRSSVTAFSYLPRRVECSDVFSFVVRC